MSKGWDRLEVEGESTPAIDWEDGGGMMEVGLGGRAIPWPSYSAGALGTANATCATCGGRMRGATTCTCEDPDWRVRGKPLDLGRHARRMKAQEDWHARWLAQAFRVLTEDGVVKAFGGSRTFHRLAMAMEAAGFPEIDLEAWIYASGMPHSTNISKAIDKHLGAKRKPKRIPYSENAMGAAGGQNTRPWIEKARERGYHELPGDEPATPEAAKWDGWGTGLKPCWEPVVVARKTPREKKSPLKVVHLLRKPLKEGSITRNVLKHGAGALNIDATRIGTADSLNGGAYSGGTRKGYAGDERDAVGAGMYGENGRLDPEDFEQPEGRWPANLILRHLPGCREGFCVEGCSVQELDRQSGVNRSGRSKSVHEAYEGESVTPFVRGVSHPGNQYDDEGGASRFYFQFGGQDDG
jgi:hypothetical protein